MHETGTTSRYQYEKENDDFYVSISSKMNYSEQSPQFNKFETYANQ